MYIYIYIIYIYIYTYVGFPIIRSISCEVLARHFLLVKPPAIHLGASPQLRRCQVRALSVIAMI